MLKNTLKEKLIIFYLKMNLWLGTIKLFRKRGLLKTKKKRIPTDSKNHGVNMIGTLDYIRVLVYCEEHERYDLWHYSGNNCQFTKNARFDKMQQTQKVIM